MVRNTNLHRLENEEFDLCIIGGGASGAGCALDAALRGLRVALVEKDDFASGTSSKSTKLIHGGVRYLEQAFKNLDFGQLRQVQHGLAERRTVLENAPHLAQPLALVTPVFSWFEGLYFSIGLKLYDFIAGKKNNLPKSRWLSQREAREKIPNLTRRAAGAVRYFDGQLDDARYCLALVQSAAEAGAAVANHFELVDFQKDKSGKISHADVCDQFSGRIFSIKSKLFVNCTGAFSDKIRHLANPNLPTRIRPSKGVHAIFPANILGGSEAMLIPKTPDGRVVFAIPFQGKTMLGTTDEDFKNLENEPKLESREVEFLVETAQRFLGNKIDIASVSAGFGGLRPLLAASSKDTKKLVRDHEVEHDTDSNLISLLGGKWTTYRLMAEDTIDFVAKILGNSEPCKTANHRLTGGENFDKNGAEKLAAEFNLAADVAQHLHKNYGSRANRVASLTIENQELALRLHPDFPFLRAEIVFAVRHEMAGSLRDFLAHRIRLEITDWRAAKEVAPVVAFHFGEILGWDEAKKRQELEAYFKMIEKFQAAAGVILPL